MDNPAFNGAVRLLPGDLRAVMRLLPMSVCDCAEEIRLRLGRKPMVVAGGGDVEASIVVERRHLELLMETVTRGSYHTAGEQLKNGFVTVEGGHRIGWTGTAVLRDGAVSAIKDIQAANVRVAREVAGVADRLMPMLCRNGAFVSTLILSPPGVGKTTLLRDVVRCVSSGGEGVAPRRIGLVDERNEVAACWQGLPTFDLGARTDVITGGRRADGLLMLLRAMAPQVLAVDEITAPQDAEALRLCAHCGATLLATAHADCVAAFRERYGPMALDGLFDRVVVIAAERGRRRYRVFDDKGVAVC